MKVTNFLELITYLINFFYLDIRYFNNLVSLSLLVHAQNILTYSGDFSGFSQSLLNEKKGIKGVDNSSFWLDSTYVKRAYTGSTCISGLYTKDVYIRVTYNKGSGIKGADIEGTGTESAGIKSICIRDICIKGTSIIGAYIEASTSSNTICTRVASIESTCIRVPYIEGFPIEGTCVRDIYAWNLNICIESIDTIEYSKMHLQSSLILKVGWYSTRLKTVVETTYFENACVSPSFWSLEVESAGLEI